MKPVFGEKCLFLLVSLSTCIQCLFAQGCPENLTNTVVYVGDSASFKLVTSYQSVQWQWLPSNNGFVTPSPLFTITNYDDVVVSNFSSLFQVSNSELTILSATAVPDALRRYPSAGLYIVNYATPNCTTAANLIVIRSGPVCSYDASDANNVALSCSVDYAASNVHPIRPVFNWIVGSSVVFHDEPTPSYGNAWNASQSQYSIGSPGATTYECRLTFSDTLQGPYDYVTSTAPDFTACCYITYPFAENCPANMANMVVYEGSPASFQRSNNSQPFQWQIFSSSDASTYNLLRNITDQDGVVDPMLTSIYASTPTGLVINRSILAPRDEKPFSTAGLYVLKYPQSSCVTAANLVVISSGPICFVHSPSPDSVTLSCMVDYASCYSNYPMLTWKNGISVVQQEIPTTSVLYRFTDLLRSESQFRVDNNDATMYECQMTFSHLYILYDYVTTAPSNFTASCFVSASDISINPTFGPIAGGTVLTIVTNFASQNVSVSAVYIGVNLTAEFYNSSGNAVLVKTPKIENETMINQPLPIILNVLPIDKNITTGKYFTYKPDPGIDDVKPRELFISGGSTLNISGYSLDSVARPLVRAAVIITNNSIITYYKESYAPCDQPTENGTKMVCTSPPIYIRQDFLLYLFNQTDPNTDVYSRRKRESFVEYPGQREDGNVLQSVPFTADRSKRLAPIKSISTNQSYITPNSQEQMVIYLGIVFDGFDKYKNNSLRDSNGNYRVTYDPNIMCSSEKIIQSTDMVTIQGSGFLRCCTKDDYTVRIGDGLCNIQDLTDNLLTCYPPANKPQQALNNTSDCKDNSAIQVKVISKTWDCSCLKYSDGDSSSKMIIIIVVTTVGGSLVIIIVIIVVSVNVRKKQKAKIVTNEPLKNEFRGAQRSTLYAPPRDMTSKTQPKSPWAGDRDMDGPTDGVRSAYYSSEIQNVNLDRKPAAFEFVNPVHIRESNEYLSPDE